jgi:hypothetical protein
MPEAQRLAEGGRCERERREYVWSCACAAGVVVAACCCLQLLHLFLCDAFDLRRIDERGIDELRLLEFFVYSSESEE